MRSEVRRNICAPHPEGLLGYRQRRHHRRHIPIPELVGQNYIHLRPHRQHRLVATLAFIRPKCFLFAAFDNRGIHIHRGNALLGAASDQLLYQIAIDPTQARQRFRLFRNVGDLLRLPSLFGGLDLLLLMKLVQKLAGCFGRGYPYPIISRKPSSPRRWPKFSIHSPPTAFSTTKLSTMVASS